VRVRDLLNKRLYGYLSWRLHRHGEHHDEVLAALLTDVRSAKPDHVVLTGDLTHLGLPNEFLMAQEMLRSLGPSSEVTVIPGNHDAYVETAWAHIFRLCSEYLVSDENQVSQGEGEDPSAAFPVLRIRGSTALIGVTTAHPTPPFLAIGRIGRVQLEKLEDILDRTRRRGLLRIVLIHHPPVAGAVSWRKRLTDRAAFQAVLARQGAELILHGHTHRSFFGHLETPFGRVSSIGVSSASALGRTARRRARYHLFRLKLNADRPELFLSVRVYSPTKRRFIDEGGQRLPLPHPIV
jgi:3',5'-cyclic AMP phosphodiesterase CpdA